MPIITELKPVQKLQNAVTSLAKNHKVSKDIFFELFFWHVCDLLRTKIHMPPQLELEFIESRPDICFVRDSNRSGMIKFVFYESTLNNKHNSHYTAMLVLYLRLLYKPNFNLSNVDDYNNFIDTIKNIPSTPYGFEIELPVNPIIDILNLERTQTAINLLKENPTTRRAYDATKTNVSISGDFIENLIDSIDCIGQPTPSIFSFDNLGFPSIGNRLSMMYVIQEIDSIVAKYKFSTRLTDIFEYSLTTMFKISTLPDNPTSYPPEGTYAFMKRDFFVELDLPSQLMDKLIPNINAELDDSAELMLQTPPTVRLSYVFVQKVFLPKLAEFLEQQPSLVQLMQVQYKSRSRPEDEFYDDYCHSSDQHILKPPRPRLV